MIRLSFRYLRYIIEYFIRTKTIKYYGKSIHVPQDLDSKTLLQIYLRRYEKPEIDCVLNNTAKATSILEIGGGAGILASIVDQVLSPRRHVIFEPIPENVARIRAQILLPGTVVRRSAIVATYACKNQASFRLRNRVFGSGFVSSNTPSLDTDQLIEVDTTPLEELNFSDFDLIVLDVEGYEDELLPEICQSASSTIVFEYHAGKCSMNLSELFSRCTNFEFEHYSSSTFIAQPVKSHGD